MTPDTLRARWRSRGANAPFYAEMTFEGVALLLGAGTALVKGASVASTDDVGSRDDARLVALLSAAHRRPVTSRSITHLRRAVAKRREGDTTLASIHLALSGVAKLERPAEGARRLFVADELIKAGIAPSVVADMLTRFTGSVEELERRYNPDQPRVPAGHGRPSGQWTAEDWAGDTPGIVTPKLSPTATSTQPQDKERPIRIADNSSGWAKYLNYLNPIGEAHAQTAEAEPEPEPERERKEADEESEGLVEYFDPATGRHWIYPSIARPAANWVNLSDLPRGPTFIGPPETETGRKPDEDAKEQTEETQRSNRRGPDEPEEHEPEPPKPATAIAAGTAIAAASVRRAQLAINRAVGRTFEQKVQKEVAENGQIIAPQITLQSDSGIKVRGDFLTMDPETGAIAGVEAKGSATAPLTTNQRIGFPEIEERGATIVGAGKPGFPGGTRIPPTKFRIVRPRSEKFMTIDQTDAIDFCATKDDNPEMSLFITDHLPWDVDEPEHLWLLQCKINKYLGAIESGELYEKVPAAVGKRIVIVLVPKYQVSKNGQYLVSRFQELIRPHGLDLRVDDKFCMPEQSR